MLGLKFIHVTKRAPCYFTGTKGNFITTPIASKTNQHGRTKTEHRETFIATMFMFYGIYCTFRNTSLIARFMGPTWGPFGADRTQVGPMLTPWTLLSGICFTAEMIWLMNVQWWFYHMKGHEAYIWCFKSPIKKNLKVEAVSIMQGLLYSWVWGDNHQSLSMYRGMLGKSTSNVLHFEVVCSLQRSGFFPCLMWSNVRLSIVNELFKCKSTSDMLQSG